MAFIPKIWQGREVEHPGRIILTPTGNPNEYDVSRSEGQVTNEGDFLGTVNLNDLEQRIANGTASVEMLTRDNLLINWYFANPVNQRAVSGTISTAGYFIDCWRLVSGTVTLTANGLTLNGTIAQTLEFDVGADVTASTLMHSGTSTATYNPSTRVFTITSSGGTVKAAKLEKGTLSTIGNDAPPSYTDMELRCRRYQNVIRPDSANIRIPNFSGQVTLSSKEASFTLDLPVGMRINPNPVMDNLQVTIRTISGYAPFATFDSPATPSVCLARISADKKFIEIGMRFEENISTNNTPMTLSIRSGQLILDANL